jgi:hypothetical protein
MTAPTRAPSGVTLTKARNDLHSVLWCQTDDITSGAGTTHIAISLIFDVAMDLQGVPEATSSSDKLLYLAADLRSRLEAIEALAAKVCGGLSPMRTLASKRVGDAP